jgi:predicted dehydrogenase
MRRIRFFQRDGYFCVDFLEQTAMVVRRREGDWGEPSIEVEKIEVSRGDALLAQLRSFVRAVRTRERPQVDGPIGLGALRTAVRVNQAMASLTTRDG